MVVIEVIPSAAKLCLIQKHSGTAPSRGTISFVFVVFSCSIYLDCRLERAATVLPCTVLFATAGLTSTYFSP